MSNKMNTISTAKLLALRVKDIAGKFHRDIGGLSAVEFALIAPMMVTIYLGAAETALGVSVNRKVSRVSSTLSDLVTQSQSITAEVIDGNMNAAFSIMEPTDATPLRIVVTGVEIDANEIARVSWSRASGVGASPEAVNSIYPIPTNIKIANSFLVVAQVQYDYDPSFGGQIVGPLNFDKKNYLRPRIGDNIDCSNC